MNGAQALIRTLVDADVDVCFMNPGTSEMHFVAALDDVPEMRGILTLFEGVATGAADGYGRMANRPAAVLLHLGPGLGNGLANLHNARKARTPIVNIVGDHATHHKQYDSQLESDIETVARNVSAWIRTTASTDDLGRDAAEAIDAAIGPPGSVATLILPADVSWSDGATPGKRATVDAASSTSDESIASVADALSSGESAAIVVGGRACREPALVAAGRLAAHTGAQLMTEVFPGRIERGAGRPVVGRLAYLAEQATKQLDGLSHLVVVDTGSPVSFFAYPGRPSDLVPDGCRVHHLTGPTDDPADALEAVAAAVGASDDAAVLEPARRPDLPNGPLIPRSIGAVLGHLLPEGAIVSDEGNTLGGYAMSATAGAPPHDWMCLTGGAIGQGLPVALGAAVACPGRRVVALQADGSSMYTNQAWWTMARERLDVTTLLLNNNSYGVLNMELDRVGATAGGPRAKAMLDLSDPILDFVAMGRAMGVRASRAHTAEELAEQLAESFATPGPALIDCAVGPKP